MYDDYDQEPIEMSHSDAPVQDVPAGDSDNEDEAADERSTKTAPRIVRGRPLVVVANPRNARSVGKSSSKGVRMADDEESRPLVDRKPRLVREPPEDEYGAATDDLRAAQEVWSNVSTARAEAEQKVDEFDRMTKEEAARTALTVGVAVGSVLTLAACYLLYRGYLAPGDAVGKTASAATRGVKAKVPSVRLE